MHEPIPHPSPESEPGLPPVREPQSPLPGPDVLPEPVPGVPPGQPPVPKPGEPLPTSHA